MASRSPAAGVDRPDSAAASEKDASLGASPPKPPPPSSASASASAPKLRSCVVCRRRKVRCDKANPCSNCRRGNIACVFPSSDRPPRWARRLERLTQDAAQSSQEGGASAATNQPTIVQAPHVMERLRTLESLVKELSSQLEHANAAVSAATDASAPTSSGNSPSIMATGTLHSPEAGMPSIADNAGFQKQFGRMVLKDANRSRYISSGFWSRVDVRLNVFFRLIHS